MRLFAPLRYSSMLFVLWFMGFGIGLVFSFFVHRNRPAAVRNTV